MWVGVGEGEREWAGEGVGVWVCGCVCVGVRAGALARGQEHTDAHTPAAYIQTDRQTDGKLQVRPCVSHCPQRAPSPC